MDNNEFDLDALLDCDEFARCESIETRCAMNSLFDLIKKNVSDTKTVDFIRGASRNYRDFVYKDAFKQGFCFAVKAMKFMLKI